VSTIRMWRKLPTTSACRLGAGPCLFTICSNELALETMRDSNAMPNDCLCEVH
jgi:hypothetical protein